jgi:Kae1-associated kinase Bud32
MTIISQGAESIIQRDGNSVLKKRPVKSYRQPELDRQLRLHRARKEIKALALAKELGLTVPCATLDETTITITMDFIEGKRLRDVIEEHLGFKYLYKLGSWIALLHDNDLVHGDLTTSNALVDITGELWLIDFGLAFTTEKIEDMAVDLHVLEQALESTHHEHKEELFTMFTEGYKSSKNYEAVLNRLAIVRGRGRHKNH